MDEYNAGMDPEVKKYFRKIINSFSYGLLWLLSAATAGFFFGLAIVDNGWHWHHIVFYIALVFSFVLLIRYFYRQWK